MANYSASSTPTSSPRTARTAAASNFSQPSLGIFLELSQRAQQRVLLPALQRRQAPELVEEVQ